MNDDLEVIDFRLRNIELQLNGINNSDKTVNQQINLITNKIFNLNN